MPAHITPLDPDSDKGREVADRLSQVLAEILFEIENDEAGEAAVQRDDSQEAA